jgi:predicted nucleic acid-binding Zn ribbon protein|tara:strand:- start:185 stop:382 length:198 start_codon:yes stop_codon:yes gene_type:complete
LRLKGPLARRTGVSAGFRLPELEKQPLSEVGPAPGRAELQKKRQVVDLKRVRRLHFFGVDFNLRI